MKKFIFILAVISGLTATEATAGCSSVFATMEECETSLSNAMTRKWWCSYESCSYDSRIGYYWCGEDCSSSCAYYTAAQCTAVAEHGSCAKDTGGCYYPTACADGYHQSTDNVVQFTGVSVTVPACEECPANATCDGTSTITCNLGYTELNGSCVAKVLDDAPILCRSGYTEVNGTCVKDETIKEETANTVNSCPPEMTLSADGCCCLNR